MKIALLISGGGTTATAVIRAALENRLRGVTPACVIASSPEAKGIERVAQAGLPKNAVFVIQPKGYQTRDLFGEAILKVCRERGVDLVCQYGWHFKTPSNVIAAYQDRMINQHPGPIDPGRPDFGGKGMFGRRVHAARMYFVRQTNREFWTEATAQRVAEEYDLGEVLNKTVVPILPDDDPQSLHERMLPIEHQVQIATLQDFADDDLHPLKRLEPLIRPGEEKILEESKRIAAILYPNG